MWAGGKAAGVDADARVGRGGACLRIEHDEVGQAGRIVPQDRVDRVEEREHHWQLRVERQARMRQAVLGSDRAHVVEVHAAPHLADLAQLVMHAQPLKRHLLLHRWQLVRRCPDCLDELPDRLVARVALGILDTKEAAATLRVALDTSDGGCAPKLEVSEQFVAQHGERPLIAIDRVATRAGEDDRRASSEDLDRLELRNGRLERHLELLLQLDEREDDHVPGGAGGARPARSAQRYSVAATHHCPLRVFNPWRIRTQCLSTWSACQ